MVPLLLGFQEAEEGHFYSVSSWTLFTCLLRYLCVVIFKACIPPPPLFDCGRLEMAKWVTGSNSVLKAVASEPQTLLSPHSHHRRVHQYKECRTCIGAFSFLDWG